MAEQLMLLVTGSSWENPANYSKITKISRKELEEIRPIISKLDKWDWSTKLVKQGDKWIGELKFFSIYPDVPKEILTKLSIFIPFGIDSINEIRLLEVLKDETLHENKSI